MLKSARSDLGSATSADVQRRFLTRPAGESRELKMNDFEIPPDELRLLRAEAEARVTQEEKCRHQAAAELAANNVAAIPAVSRDSVDHTSAEWYLLPRGGRKRGPMTIRELAGRVSSHEDRIRRKTDQKWVAW